MLHPSPESSSLETEIQLLGRKIFAAIGAERPSAFDKNFLVGRILKWSMSKPDLKINMFRLVDVLPALKSRRAIAAHVKDYLADALSDLNPLLGLSVKGPIGLGRSALIAGAVKVGVSQMARQFIVGEDPVSALPALRKLRRSRLSFTVDLLGEFSVSEREALTYVDRYLEALTVFSERMRRWPESAPIIPGHPGERGANCVSVKLSALYSQCGPLNFEGSVAILSDRLARIARKAAEVGAAMYVDAEDSANNPIIYQSFKNVFGASEFRDFPYPGIVVQAYAKNSGQVLDDLLAFARRRDNPIAVRLVKGAYWDYETTLSRQNDWPSPLFSRKQSSDANFEALSRVLVDNHKIVLPAFASHNIRSLAHAVCYARQHGLTNREYELQMLFGMADPIARAFAREDLLIRFYAPLGRMLPGMGYLVRRLLENTSNESFLRHTFFDQNEVEALLTRPTLSEHEEL